MPYYFDFRDGPAKEASMLMFHRAPLYLRVVRGMDGKWDALDQLDDEPALGDTIFIYKQMQGRYGHIKGATRATSGFILGYEHTDAIDPEGMEDTAAWRVAVENLKESEAQSDG